MSSSVPGSSGETLPYYVLVVVAFTGGGFYAYRTLIRDKARFHDRHDFINTQLRPALDDYETKSNKEEAVPETIEEAVEAAIEEAAAEEVTEQGAAPIASVEQEPTVTEEETASAPTQQEPAVVEDETAAAPTQQEPAPSTDAASEQVEPLNTEPAEETLEETSPVLEASSDNIIEELASAAEDWSELTARKPEETEVESAPEVKVCTRILTYVQYSTLSAQTTYISTFVQVSCSFFLLSQFVIQ
ncbi:hypothetical protein GDO81_000604 [Engystomops pustulosus]|uniref:Protein MGARP N-terminal domain-containing protein n=1 Tax=Engystomops pustulosus TaxID=76066 RepID=A0AAV7D6Y0_ENGPU|nr:hypothetical protein GDO81_000604 [Engystomops pustulosus]